MRRVFLIFCFLLIWTVSCQVKKLPPNIIFIMADDHATQAISAYDTRLIETPHIDRLAREGILFSNCFCTNGICAPSRATILTGKYSHLNGVIDNRLPFDSTQQTFPKLLRAHGYQTAVIGKWHLKSEPTGFDYWNIVPDQGHYYNPDFIEMGKQRSIHGYVTDIITDLCIQWLDRRDPGRPFLLLYHHKAPHRNWMPALRHLTLFNDRDLPEPGNLFDDYSGRSDAARQQEMTIARHMYPAYDLKLPAAGDDSLDIRMWQSSFNRLDPEQRRIWQQAYDARNIKYSQAPPTGTDLVRYKYQRYIKDYLRCIVAIDENIGRLFDYLDEHHMADNTIVIYTSDQGFFLGEHGWFDKRFMYEEALRMPLLIRYPAEIKAATINDRLVQNIDFAPTILDWAGIDIPGDMQGVSLRPLTRGEVSADWRRAIYYHYYEYPAWHMVRPHYGIRTERDKLIHFYSGMDQWEFYDLRTDPHEMSNCYSDSAYVSRIDSLKQELQELQKAYQDTLF